jgi:hypothetical protein
MSDCRIAVSSADGSGSSSQSDPDPRDDYPRVLERLTQTLDRIPAELGELVEEQDTVVPEGSQMYLDGLA